MPEFEAAYSEARQALVRQAVGRLQQAAGAAVTTLLRVIYDSGASRAARLKAADRVLSHTKITGGMEAIGLRLRAVKRTREALKAARPGKGDGAASGDESRSSRKAGHGAKFGRRKEEAIVALLTQRNVEEAARVVPVGTTTLYRWMKDAEFHPRLRIRSTVDCGKRFSMRFSLCRIAQQVEPIHWPPDRVKIPSALRVAAMRSNELPPARNSFIRFKVSSSSGFVPNGFAPSHRPDLPFIRWRALLRALQNFF